MTFDNTKERRSRVRFPLTVQLDYRRRESTTRQTGTGQSVNISSVGVLFVAEQELALGERVELALEWPAPLEGVVPLRLCLFGRIVRVEGLQAAAAIDRHEFRTTRRPGASAPSPKSSRMG